MVLVTAAPPEAVRADKGETRKGRDQSALCRLALSPGAQSGRKTSCLSPLSRLLCFFSLAGSRAGFPFSCDNPGVGYSEVAYSTAAWRKAEKKQLVPSMESSGDWWKMTSRLPHPLVSVSA